MWHARREDWRPMADGKGDAAPPNGGRSHRTNNATPEIKFHEKRERRVHLEALRCLPYADAVAAATAGCQVFKTGAINALSVIRYAHTSRITFYNNVDSHAGLHH